jgi:hypothetical protein
MPKKKKHTTKKRAAPKAKKPAPNKTARSKKAVRPQKPVHKKTARPLRRPYGGSNEAAPMMKGPGPASAGQSGDLEGLSDVEGADSESVEELVEEGQDFEAEIVDAVENAPDPDEAEISTEVPEDDLDPDSGSFSRRNRL